MAEHWKQFFGGKHLGSFDLPDEGKGKAMLTITEIGTEDIDGGRKGLITFEPSPTFAKVCKKTTWLAPVTVGQQLATMFGSNPRGWIGKRIVIFSTMVGGEPALRIYGSPDITAPCECKVREYGGGKRTWKMVPITAQPAAPAQNGD